MLNKLKRILKQNGLFGGIKYIINKLSGKAALIESIDTLYYFLEKTVDITKFPKAEGCLRDLQLCDAELLKIFHLVCKKHSLTYWLDYGTLLGAVRHNGFIPWDDDLDVAMPRKDYDRALEILPSELAKVGIDVGEFSFKPLASFGFSIKHRQTGIWLDVFPVDEYFCANEQDEQKLVKAVAKYQRYYKRNKLKKSKQQLLAKKDVLLAEFKNKTQEKNIAVLCHEIEFLDPKLIRHYSDQLYPLDEIEFEGFKYVAPGNVDLYLTVEYGKNYMSFPKGGVEHHGEEAGKLKSWAEKNNVNMNEILKELEKITAEYSKKG